MAENECTEPVKPKPGWMLPLPRGQRLEANDDVARGPLVEDPEECGVDEFVPPLFIDRLHEATEASLSSVIEMLEDEAWPLHKEFDATRLAYRRQVAIEGFGARTWGAKPKSAAEQVATHNARDRTGKPGSLTEQQWFVIGQVYEGRCAYCLCKLVLPTLEHVRPIFMLGATEIGNVVPSCAPCNREKGTKTIEEWMGAEDAAKFMRDLAKRTREVKRRMRRKA